MNFTPAVCSLLQRSCLRATYFKVPTLQMSSRNFSLAIQNLLRTHFPSHTGDAAFVIHPPPPSPTAGDTPGERRASLSYVRRRHPTCCVQGASRLLFAGSYTSVGIDQLERDSAGQEPAKGGQLGKEQLCCTRQVL